MQQPKVQPKNTGEELGEGNRTAAKRYNAGVEQTVKSGQVEELADEAKKALAGPEGEALRAAEEKAKKGAPEPKQKR